MKVEIEVDADDLGRILVKELQGAYADCTYFQDKKLAKAIRKVIRYYMCPEEYQEWRVKTYGP